MLQHVHRLYLSLGATIYLVTQNLSDLVKFSASDKISVKINLKEEKFILATVSVQGQRTPLFLGPWVRQSIMVGRGKLLASWHRGVGVRRGWEQGVPFKAMSPVT